MAKNWYVLHTYSGYENKIERTIRMLIDEGKLGQSVTDIKVPSEQVVEVKDGKRRVLSGWKGVLSEIRRINGVTGFVGSSPGAKPQPITQEEARTILQKTGEIKDDRSVKSKDTYMVGETVRIIDGPFSTFTGAVEDVNLERAKLRVMVGIFGRNTPVELDFVQVEKL